MKKNLFLGLIALTALTVTSCQNDEVMEAVPQKQAIEFGTYLGRDAQGRGVELTNSNLLDFGVYASYSSNDQWNPSDLPNFMYNQLVSRTTTSDPWGYTPKKYWPTKNTNEYISFFAFAPYHTVDNGIAINSDNNTSGTPTLTYTIATDKLNKLADFTTDVIMNKDKAIAGDDPDDSDEIVTFNFKHELTRLGITAQLDRIAFDATDANKTKVNIKSINFTGDGFATQATYKFADVSDARGTWTHAAASTLQVKAGDTGSVLVNNNTSSWISAYTTKGFLLENETQREIFGANNYLFLIPPTLDGITDAMSVSMHIYYDIVTADDKLVNGHSVTSAAKEIKIPVGLLKQGKAYKFALTFNLNEIKFTASVDSWGDPVDGSDNVDWPDTDI